MPGNALIGNLAINLTMETAAFQRAATQTEKRVATLGKRVSGLGASFKTFSIGFAGGIAAGLVPAISGVVSSAFNMASSLSEAAEKVGVSVEALQELRTAASQTGISNEQLETSMGRLNRSMGDLALGKDSAEDAFDAIGLAAEDLKGKTPDQALRIIADALNKIPDAATRASLGAAIFGKGYAALIPLINGGSKALDDYAEKSRKNGQISTEDAKKLDELADGWDQLKTRVGVATVNIVASGARFLEFYDGLVKGFWKARDGVYAALDGMVQGVWKKRDETVAAMREMATRAVAAVGDMVTGIGQAITGRLTAIWEGAKAKIEAVKKAFKDMYVAVVGNSYVPDMVRGIGDWMSQLQKIMVDPSLSATAKVGAAFEALAGTIGGLFGKKAGGILGAIGGLVGVLAPLFGSKAPISTGSIPRPVTGIGMARGGSGVFGGRSGIDRNLVSMNGSPILRVSKGEHFSVTPANNNRRMHFDLRGAVMTPDLLRQMNEIGTVAIGQGGMLGAASGQAAVYKRSARMLPR